MSCEVIVNLSHRSALQRFGNLLIEGIDLLGNFLLFRSFDLRDNFEASTLERHKPATETKSGATFGMKVLGSVTRPSLLAGNGS